jgi:hypothetical protein
MHFVNIKLEGFYTFERRRSPGWAALILHNGELYKVVGVTEVSQKEFIYDITAETIPYEWEESQTITIRWTTKHKIFRIWSEFVYLSDIHEENGE